MNLETITCEINNFIATVTINRPKALNALNNQVISELDRLFADHLTHEDVRCVVLTGSGEKSFVAGADIKEMESYSEQEALKMSLQGQKVLKQIESFKTPVIAAVNGFALGGGLELALSCDFIVASSKARFALPEVGLGLIPGYGGTQRLSRVIGKAKAKRMAVSGEMIAADKAYDWGLVTEVCEPDQLMESCLKLATTICEKAPLAVSWAKQAVDLGYEKFQVEALNAEAELFSKTFTTKDKLEGVAAFIEKRKADFKGN